MSSKHLTKSDVVRYGLDGDAGFSPERNAAEVKKSIELADKMHAVRRKKIDDGLEERSDLVYSYIRHMLNNNKDMKIEDYAGWHKIKALWGKTRLQEMQDRALQLGYSI